jgi:2-phospho-L-lactate guanylyltransferase
MAGLLTDSQRIDLNGRLLNHTLHALKQVHSLRKVLVISSDPFVLDLAHRQGFGTIEEAGPAALNESLEKARAVAVSRGASAVFVLPADLPGLHPEGIEEVISHLGEGPLVVIAPDRHRRGTNALLVSPAGLIDFRFGPESFVRHSAGAYENRARLVIIENWGLALDLDSPEDISIAAMTLGDRESGMILSAISDSGI